MPRPFYSDLEIYPTSANHDSLCGHETEMWDGPGICNRAKGHEVETMTNSNFDTGEFHQESFEGWVWDGEGSVG